MSPKATLDQFGTFEVFVQPRENKPFQHEGIVHAPDLEMAFVLAKETFTRRFTCASLCVVETSKVWVSALTEGAKSAYEEIPDSSPSGGEEESYEIYHLSRRGKQHVHAGTVSATHADDAFAKAKAKFGAAMVCNIWAIRTADIRFAMEDEKELWLTLPEKKFRDAAEYKGGDKLKSFLERTK